jgi:hypothetical protein
MKENHMEVNVDFSNAGRLVPSLWSKCKVEKQKNLPHNINGDCAYELPYNKDNMMASSSDARSEFEAVDNWQIQACLDLLSMRKAVKILTRAWTLRETSRGANPMQANCAMNHRAVHMWIAVIILER